MKKTLYILALFLFIATQVHAQQQKIYLCELGLHAGVGYYVGDATPHIFMNPREAYGLKFRYKFDQNWAIQAKATHQPISFNASLWQETKGKYTSNDLHNIDLTAEFNFFQFGLTDEYDDRIKPFTPYIFLGVGAAIYNNHSEKKNNAAPYIPLGIGFKWKFFPRWILDIAWQHNVYFADNIEGYKNLDNTHNLNGWNIMNNDLTGMITIGITYEFGLKRYKCRFCKE